jgi:uncharacterized membrane protein
MEVAMSFTFYLKLYLSTVVAFFAIDMLWLGLVARNMYSKYLGFLLSPKPNWIAAIVFYLLFILGLIVFAVIPGLKAESLKTALLLAALFGLVTYATYDLTNLATLKNWPLGITIIDMVWGVVLSCIVTWISFLVGKWLG